MSGFYWRLIKRQWRLGAIRLFSVAVMLACAVTFSITLLSDRLEQLFERQSREVLAADLVLRSTTLLTDTQQTLIESVALQRAQTTTFRTMAQGNDDFLLSSVKAVSNNYPLRGQLQISDQLYGNAKESAAGPKPGEAWVEDRILNELDLTIGDPVTVGERTFQITQVLVFEPDRGNSFYSFTPRIMINLNDLEATNVVQPGSRVNYNYMFAGNDDALAELRTALEQTLEANQKFATIEEANETLATTLQRAYNFLNITALIAVLLGAVGVALVTYQYANEMTYQYAVLRCLGLKGNALYGAITIPFAIFSLLSIGLGLALGGSAHYFIINNLTGLIPGDLPAPSAKPFILGSMTALIVVMSFAWPFLRNLIQTPPKILLNKENAQSLPLGLMTSSMAIGILILVQMNTRNWQLTLSIMLGMAASVVIAYALIQLLIQFTVKRSQRTTVYARMAARMLKANRRMTSLQIIAIGITFFSLALIQTLRDDLLNVWQSKVPEDAPNYFVINLFENDLEPFANTMANHGITRNPLYPVVRGRLTHINEQPVREVVSKEDSRAQAPINRDLSLTWATELPNDNIIKQGQWHAGGANDHNTNSLPEVSIELELAERLGINLGDQLSFSITTQTVQAVVTSLREVDWESFSPNFYMMFEPRALKTMPATYITSFHLENNQRQLLPGFVKQFSNASFFDVDFLLQRIRGITQQIGLAIESILYFSLAASLVVFIAIEMILHRNRHYSTAIYKALGARTQLIQRVFRSQFLMIGLMAGLMAYTLNSLISLILSVYLIEGDYVLNIKTLVLCFLITPLLVLSVGYFSIQRTRKASAKQLLNES